MQLSGCLTSISLLVVVFLFAQSSFAYQMKADTVNDIHEASSATVFSSGEISNEQHNAPSIDDSEDVIQDEQEESSAVKDNNDEIDKSILEHGASGQAGRRRRKGGRRRRSRRRIPYRRRYPDDKKEQKNRIWREDHVLEKMCNACSKQDWFRNRRQAMANCVKVANTANGAKIKLEAGRRRSKSSKKCLSPTYEHGKVRLDMFKTFWQKTFVRKKKFEKDDSCKCVEDMVKERSSMDGVKEAMCGCSGLCNKFKDTLKRWPSRVKVCPSSLLATAAEGSSMGRRANLTDSATKQQLDTKRIHSLDESLSGKRCR